MIDGPHIVSKLTRLVKKPGQTQMSFLPASIKEKHHVFLLLSLMTNLNVNQVVCDI